MKMMLPSDRKAEKRKIIEALSISVYWAYTNGDFKLAKLVFKDAMNFSKYVDTCLFELIDTLIRSLTIENVANDDIGQGVINGDEAF